MIDPVTEEQIGEKTGYRKGGPKDYVKFLKKNLKSYKPSKEKANAEKDD